LQRLLVNVLTVLGALVVASTMAVAGTPTPAPATPTAQPAPFDIQAKVLQVAKGWVRVEVVKVATGTGLQPQAKLRVRQTAKTKFLKAGKAASIKDLKAGEMVQISGTISGSGKTLTYQAASVTIMK
jgi:hypothetical protein